MGRDNEFRDEEIMVRWGEIPWLPTVVTDAPVPLVRSEILDNVENPPRLIRDFFPLESMDSGVRSRVVVVVLLLFRKWEGFVVAVEGEVFNPWVVVDNEVDTSGTVRDLGGVGMYAVTGEEYEAVVVDGVVAEGSESISIYCL